METHPSVSALPVIAALLDAWNAHDVERLLTFYTTDYEGVNVADATPHHGLDGVRTFFERYYQALPDLHFTSDAVVGEGEQIAWFWTARGTQLGRLMNIPPTGRHIEVCGASLLTLRGDKVAKAFYIWDVAGLLRNLGLLPELV
jgi:steroid delta-isomerase-like uncharacterized protein